MNSTRAATTNARVPAGADAGAGAGVRAQPESLHGASDAEQQRDFGVYVHIPYCRSLCPYCDFNSYVDAAPPWHRLERALIAELRAHGDSFQAAPWRLRSIYFGGGTPSLAPPSLVERIIAVVKARFACAAGAADADADADADAIEVTLEANPGSIDAATWEAFARAGVNRASLGWQSADDRLLRTLGRGHTAADSLAAYRDARAAGIENVSVDLIFGVPGQRLEHLHSDLDAVLSLHPLPNHLSIYELTYHEGTPLHRRRASGRVRAIDEDTIWRMTQQLEARLCASGYEHYEISNYARDRQHRAVHNSLYWAGAPYLGLGPGAHSFWRTDDFTRGSRWESIRDPSAYLARWTPESQSHSEPESEPESESQRRCSVCCDVVSDHGRGDHGRGGCEPPLARDDVAWSESLTAAQLTTERMLCGLRHVDGAPVPPMADAVQEAVRRGWARLGAGRLRPTPLGFRYADSLAALFA